jgi:hypothetical protein
MGNEVNFIARKFLPQGTSYDKNIDKRGYSKYILISKSICTPNQKATSVTKGDDAQKN